MKKRVLLSCIVTCLLLLSSACVIEQGKQEDSSYNNDDMLGITNANPNLRTSPTHYDYSNDLKLAEQALKQVSSVLDSRVIINGGKIFVKIRIPDGLSRNEIEQIEMNAYDVLAFQLPRYEVHLTSDKSNIGRNQRVRD